MDALSQTLPQSPLLILELSVFEEKYISLAFIFSFGWVYSDPVFHVCKMSFAARVLLQGQVWWKVCWEKAKSFLNTDVLNFPDAIHV